MVRGIVSEPEDGQEEIMNSTTVNTVNNEYINHLLPLEEENEIEIIPGFVDHNGNPVQLTYNQVRQLMAVQLNNDPTEEILDQLHTD